VIRRPQTETGKPKRRLFVRVLRFLILTFVALSLIIVGLTVLYRFVPPTYSALMLWRMADNTRMDYRWRPLNRISENLAYAVIASEDARFCQHAGVDWREAEKVWRKFRKDINQRPRGASTIPMQVARNLYLWPSRNYLRKALEIPIALLIDAVWPKRRMIEIYLNIVEWGPGIYGAEAASRKYFQRSAQRLTKAQAALLAAALPNPRERNSARPTLKHKRLAISIKRRLKTIKRRATCFSPKFQG